MLSLETMANIDAKKCFWRCLVLSVCQHCSICVLSDIVAKSVLSDVLSACRTKDNSRVGFDETMDMAKYLTKNSGSEDGVVNTRYELRAVVVHHGSGSSAGHYTAYARAGSIVDHRGITIGRFLTIFDLLLMQVLTIGFTSMMIVACRLPHLKSSILPRTFSSVRSYPRQSLIVVAYPLLVLADQRK